MLPEADVTNVAVDTTVSVTFSDIMDAPTITTSSFTLVTDSTPVSGSVSYNSSTYTAASQSAFGSYLAPFPVYAFS